MIKMDTYLSIIENYDIIIIEKGDSAKSNFKNKKRMEKYLKL